MNIIRLVAVLGILLAIPGCMREEPAIGETQASGEEAPSSELPLITGLAQEAETPSVGDAGDAPASQDSPVPVTGPVATGGITIAEVLASPGEYKGRTVSIRGRVVSGLAFEFVDEQPFLFEDDTGQMWGVTWGAMPPEGETVDMEGVVETPYQIKGRHYEVVLVVGKRRP